jgi:colanic acid biosynthesis protein WcaH
MKIPQPEYNLILELVPIVCVDVAINCAGKILLVKRRDEPAMGEWWLPGGRLYKREGLETCAFRKAMEEVGLECRIGQMIHYASTNFGSIHSVNFVYLLYTKQNDVKLDDTCLDYKWVSQLDGNYHSYIKASLLKAFAWL